MFNMGQIMKQVQQMQGKMNTMQENLVHIEAEGQAGNGLVKARMNGKGELKELKIDPSLVDPEDIEMLEDTVLAAINNVKAHIDAEIAKETEKVMGDVKLPAGMKLPF